jgi:hypothetical protein
MNSNKQQQTAFLLSSSPSRKEGNTKERWDSESAISFVRVCVSVGTAAAAFQHVTDEAEAVGRRGPHPRRLRLAGSDVSERGRLGQSGASTGAACATNEREFAACACTSASASGRVCI